MYSLQSYQDENSVDLVASFLEDPDGNAYSYATKAGHAIWANYRYAIMNTCGDSDGIKRWVQRAKDIAYNCDERYSQLFTAYENFKATGDITSIAIKQKQTTGTHGTVVNTGDVTNTNTNNQTVIGTTEAIPQYANAGGIKTITKNPQIDSDGKVVKDDNGKIVYDTDTVETENSWLTGRTKTTPEGTIVDKRDDNTTATTDVATTTEIDGTAGVLPSELIQRMKDGMFNPYLEYADEFRSLFVPFWIDECGCCR